jgi:hypothetical protein
MLKNQLNVQFDPALIEPDCKRAMDVIRKDVRLIRFTDHNRSIQKIALRK